MIMEAGDIFRTVTSQIFNILSKRRCSANTMSVLSLILTCSELGYTEIPLSAAHFDLKLVAGDTAVIQLRDTATAAPTAVQMCLHLFSINTGHLCVLFPFTPKRSLQELWFHLPLWLLFSLSCPLLFSFRDYSEVSTVHLALYIEMQKKGSSLSKEI